MSGTIPLPDLHAPVYMLQGRTPFHSCFSQQQECVCANPDVFSQDNCTKATYLCHLSCCCPFCSQVCQSQSSWYAPRGKENVFSFVGLIQLVEKINCKLANGCWDHFHFYNLEGGNRQNCTVWMFKFLYTVHISEKCCMCNTIHLHTVKLIAQFYVYLPHRYCLPPIRSSNFF